MGAIISLIRRQIGKVVSYVIQGVLQVKATKQRLKARALLYQARSWFRARPKRYQIECVVFSKDRALQLHTLLASYLECAKSPAPVTVLYRCSSDSHLHAYREVTNLFEKQPIRFCEQKSPANFRAQLLEILRDLKSDKVFFLVDDDVFIGDVDISDFARADPTTEIASLRLGGCLRKSYVVAKEQPLPPWISGEKQAGETRLRWRWEEGWLEWNYPISVDGHLFSTDEICAMARAISFQSPSSFEANLQVFKEVFLRRDGVCYECPVIVNIPCNKVQGEIPNRFGIVHQDALLQAWQNGMCMDYRKLRGLRPESTHQEIEFHLIERSRYVPVEMPRSE